jgi:hypothetical protein
MPGSWCGEEDTMTRLIALLPLLALTACDQIDPYSRDGVWRPNGANDTDLRAMVSVPSDLARAAPASPSDGAMAAAAAARLRHDRTRPLLDSGVAQIVPVNGAPAAAPPAAAPTGTGE